MQVAITCRHGSIDDDERNYITKKSEKLLTYFERVTEIDVTVDFDGGRVAVEILVDAEHTHNFVASVESTGQVRGVFDTTLSKMEKQIRRHKEKLKDRRRDKPLKEVAAPPPPEPADE